MLGDDSEVRAYYAACKREMDAARARGLSNTDEILCRYQRTSGSVRERPYDISTNVYGWAMGSTLLSNLGGGPWAVSPRRASLAECIELGCAEAGEKGTTLTLSPASLVRDGGLTVEQAVELTALAGGTEEQIAWVRAIPERRAAEEAVRAAQAEAYARHRDFADRVCASFRECSAVRATNGVTNTTATITIAGASSLPGTRRFVCVEVTSDGARFTTWKRDDGSRGYETYERRGLGIVKGDPTVRAVRELLIGAWRAVAALDTFWTINEEPMPGLAARRQFGAFYDVLDFAAAEWWQGGRPRIHGQAWATQYRIVDGVAVELQRVAMKYPMRAQATAEVAS